MNAALYYFVSNTAPIMVFAVLFVVFCSAIKTILRGRARSARSFGRQQALWSNWS